MISQFIEPLCQIYTRKNLNREEFDAEILPAI